MDGDYVSRRHIIFVQSLITYIYNQRSQIIASFFLTLYYYYYYYYYYVAAKATYIRLLHGKIGFLGFFRP